MDDGVVGGVFFRHNTAMIEDVNNPVEAKPPWAVITRDLADAADFVVHAKLQGYRVCGLPLILITCIAMPFAPPLNAYDWLVFTSRWGIQQYLEQGGTIPMGLNVAVVGSQAKALLEQQGFRVALMGEEGTSHSLAIALLATSPQPKRVLWPCGDRALQEWTQPLAECGWAVDPLVVYRTQLRTRLTPEEIFACQQAVVIAVTSPSCAQALFDGLQQAGVSLGSAAKLVAIGPTTQNTLMEQWGRCDEVAWPHTLAGLSALLQPPFLSRDRF